MIEISKLEKLAFGLLTLNKQTGRRSIAETEYQKFNKYLHENYEFTDAWVSTMDTEEIHEYFDEIVVDGSKVYRLRPDCTLNDLNKIVIYFPTNFLKVVFSPDAIDSFDVFTKEDEDDLKQFKLVDERYQLQTLLELANLEKKLRSTKKKLQQIRNNSGVYIDVDLAKNILKSEDVLDVNNFTEMYEGYFSR